MSFNKTAIMPVQRSPEVWIQRSSNISSLVYKAFGATSTAGDSRTADVPDAPVAALRARPVPSWTVAEPWWRKTLFLILALALTAGFFVLILQYWAPAHPGVDQNGYLVGGRLLAEHGSMAIHPDANPYTFIGRMWIGVDLGTPAERYYPKYPVGLPLLVAGAWLVQGPWLVYLLSPLAMSAGVLACYLLLRQVVGTFASILGCIVLAVSPVTLTLADNPNSHATTFFCVTWGMYFLFSWWRRGGLFRAILAGLLIGYATTIRYTEGLLILPVVLTILFAMRWRSARSWVQSIVLLSAWALPVALLLWHNQVAFGAWTGYDPTNESTGFSWANFQDNWETMLRQLENTGLFFMLPLGVLGLMCMAFRRFRVAMVLLAWTLPSLLLYTSYYWAPDGAGLGYMRFFLTVFPPLVMGAMWLLEQVRPTVAVRPPQPDAASHGRISRFVQRLIAPLPLGVVVAVAVLMSASTAAPQLENNARAAVTTDQATRIILDTAPAQSVIFSEARLLHHLQFVGDYELYSFEPFSTASLQRLRAVNEDEPNPLQAQRAAALLERLNHKTASQLTDEQNTLMRSALEAGHSVYFVVPRASYDRLYKRFVARGFTERAVAVWEAPGPMRSAPRPRWIGFGANQRPRPVPPALWTMIQISLAK